MLTLKLILVLALLGWSIYSAAVYWRRRGDNQAALRSLRDGTPPARTLTAAESAALAPFLFEPLKPDRAMPLQRDGVFLLHGEYVRHGLHTSQGGETMHDTIGGVEVILPYDARDFLEPLNRAEVVFTEKFALVVGLNDTFDLIGGRMRAQRRQQQDQQWKTGQSGEVTDVEPLDADAAAREADHTVREVLRVEMLGQRDETPAETAARAGLARGWLASLAWGLAFAGFGIASTVASSDRLYWLAPAVLLAALALWWTWGPVRPGAPGKVNRVRGHVAAIAMPKPGGGVGPVRWFVGDKYPVVLPAHWQSRWTVPPEGPVDVEMRVNDHTAVRFGKALSLDDELTRFAPVRWGRHALLALTGALALGGVLLFTDGLSNDLVLAQAWLRGTPGLTAGTPAAFAAGAPEVGTPVRLSGRAICQWGGADGFDRPGVDCTALRWDTPAKAVPPVVVDELTRALHDGSFLQARRNVGLDVLVQLQQMQQMQVMGNLADPLARYQAMANAPKVISGVAELVRTVDTACSQASGPCERLRGGLVEGLVVDGEDTPKDWAGWSRRAARGELEGERDVAVMRGVDASSVQSAGRAVAEERASALITQALAARQAASPAAVQLSVRPGPGTRLPAAPEGADVLAYIEALGEGAEPPAEQPFEVTGLLVARGAGPGGVPVWHVDASRSLDDPVSSLTIAGALALSVLLLVGHGMAFAVRVRQTSRRGREVAAFNDRRSPAEGFGA